MTQVSEVNIGIYVLAPNCRINTLTMHTYIYKLEQRKATLRKRRRGASSVSYFQEYFLLFQLLDQQQAGSVAYPP